MCLQFPAQAWPYLTQNESCWCSKAMGRCQQAVGSVSEPSSLCQVSSGQTTAPFVLLYFSPLPFLSPSPCVFCLLLLLLCVCLSLHLHSSPSPPPDRSPAQKTSEGLGTLWDRPCASCVCRVKGISLQAWRDAVPPGDVIA